MLDCRLAKLLALCYVVSTDEPSSHWELVAAILWALQALFVGAHVSVDEEQT